MLDTKNTESQVDHTASEDQSSQEEQTEPLENTPCSVISLSGQDVAS